MLCLYAFGRVTMPFALSSCIWHSHYVFGIVIIPLAWSPCLEHDFHASGTTALLLLTFWRFLHFRHFFAYVLATSSSELCLNPHAKLLNFPPHMKNQTPNFFRIPKNKIKILIFFIKHIISELICTQKEHNIPFAHFL